MDYKSILSSRGVVLVEFYATWCPHCQRMMPVVEEVKNRLSGKVSVYQFDIDKNEADASSANIDVVPTFIVYNDGKEIWRYSGEITLDELLDKVESVA